MSSLHRKEKLIKDVVATYIVLDDADVDSTAPWYIAATKICSVHMNRANFVFTIEQHSPEALRRVGVTAMDAIRGEINVSELWLRGIVDTSLSCCGEYGKNAFAPEEFSVNPKDGKEYAPTCTTCNSPMLLGSIHDCEGVYDVGRLMVNDAKFQTRSTLNRVARTLGLMLGKYRPTAQEMREHIIKNKIPYAPYDSAVEKRLTVCKKIVPENMVKLA